MLGNVSLFIAACAVFLVVVYIMNKDSAKEVSPFAGGPAPNMESSKAAPERVSAEAQPSKESAPKEERALGGQVIVAPALLPVSGGTLFIVVRNQGSPNQGPPLAVVRVEEPSFPLRFRVSEDNVMMNGTPFQGPFDVYARLDKDGNAATKDPGDLMSSAPSSGVPLGTSELQLALDQRL